MGAREPARPIEVVIADGARGEGEIPLVSAVLEALFDNAWKFTRRREPAQIEFGVRPGDPSVYYVRNNGAGFDRRYAGELFDPFRRLHTEQEFEGVWVGLVAVQRIIRRHGGPHLGGGEGG